MPALENPKHEKTIQLRVKGYSQRQAYKEGFGVNYSDDAIDALTEFQEQYFEHIIIRK